MNCPKCGTLLEEDANFCVFCGTQYESNEKIKQTITTTSSSFERNNGKGHSQKRKKKLNRIGLVVGSLFIVIGLMRIFTAGTSISSTSFGGDFYTYTYQGIVAISEILVSIEITLGWIVVAIGSTINIISFKR